MRVIVLRKQQEIETDMGGVLEQVPEEVRRQVEEALEEKKEVFDRIGDIFAEITRLRVNIENTLTETNRTIIENFRQLKVEDLQRVQDSLEQVRDALQEAASAVENLGINLRKGGTNTMRVVILRKQEMGELPTENEEEMRRQLVEQVRQLLRELETNVEGMSIDEIKALLQQLGAGQQSLRKGEVAIITESDLEDLEGLVQAVEELKENFPPLDRNEAKNLLKVVRKAMEKLTAIERSLEEGIVELRKQMEEFYDTEELGDTEEKLYSPDDIIKREKEKIRPIEGLVFSLKEEMASLKRALDDIEDNADLLAIPGERDVFIEEGWFHKKVRAIRSHVLEIAEMGMELVRRLAELGGVEIKEPWKR
jgi:uncharacterized phage infection (PIP) family protein YhgE